MKEDEKKESEQEKDRVIADASSPRQTPNEKTLEDEDRNAREELKGVEGGGGEGLASTPGGSV